MAFPQNPALGDRALAFTTSPQAGVVPMRPCCFRELPSPCGTWQERGTNKGPHLVKRPAAADCPSAWAKGLLAFDGA